VSIVEIISRDGYLLGDGAMGTMLQDAGLLDDAPERWNTTHPEVIERVMEHYAEAGAGFVTTCSFGGSAPRLALHGLQQDVVGINRTAASVARRVADRHRILVAGDVGPTGELLEPLGALAADEARDVFACQIRGLVDGGCDFILIETMSDLAEVEAAIDATRVEAPRMPIMATMSFDTNLRTMMGVTPKAAVTRLSERGVDVVGANCGRGPDEMTLIMRQMRDACPGGTLLAAQTNAGMPRAVGDQFVYDADPDVLAAWALSMRSLGVGVIGGCCGSTPSHIAAMRDALAA
jgi:5-methyltetrahydrofolate--homocysteine methyltransferase